MQKKDVYFVLWLVAFLASACPYFFLTTAGEEWIIPLLVSLIYKLGLCVTGTVYAVKDWKTFQEEKKMHRGVMVPFYVVVVILVQIILITVLMAFTSSRQEIYESTRYLAALAIFLIVFMVGNYFWEIDFFRTVDNKAVRIIFSITTPLILFFSDLVFTVLVAMIYA